MDYGMTVTCYDGPTRARPAARAMHACAAEGLCGEFGRRIPRNVSERLDDVIRCQRDLLHVARRRHERRSRAVFCRFSGCNLWSGREADRAKAVCNSAIQISSVRMAMAEESSATAQDLADAIAANWPKNDGGKTVRRLHRRRAAAAAGCGLIDALHRAQLRDRSGDQRHFAVPEGSTGFA